MNIFQLLLRSNSAVCTLSSVIFIMSNSSPLKPWRLRWCLDKGYCTGVKYEIYWQFKIMQHYNTLYPLPRNVDWGWEYSCGDVITALEIDVGKNENVRRMKHYFSPAEIPFCSSLYIRLKKQDTPPSNLTPYFIQLPTYSFKLSFKDKTPISNPSQGIISVKTFFWRVDW